MAPLSDLFSKIPMGKNSIEDSSVLYDEKKFYYDKVYPGGDLPWMDKPFDFINENPLYGKVNLNGEFLIPKYNLVNDDAKYEKIVEVVSGIAGVQTFDFVAEAFNDLRKNILSLVAAGYLSREGPIAAFEAKKGFVDFESMNKLQKDIHYFMFVSQYLSKSATSMSGIKYKELLENAFDFTSFFVSYLKTHTKTMPFTKSGIINSFYMAPMSTGLCLEIDDKPYDDDQIKHEFLQDPNFNVYRITARRFGFMIDRNVPWRLVADVQSFKMREYMRLAYERKMITAGQSAILKSKEEEIKDIFPELPELDDLYELKDGEWKLKDFKFATWNNDMFNEFTAQTEKALRGVLSTVSESTKAFVETAEMYGAKDPIKNQDGTNMCTGDKFQTCTSRIFRFDKFFEVYYDVPYLDEIEEIKKTFYNNFYSYYVQNPTIKKKTICTDKNLRTKFIVKEVNIDLTTESQYNEYYSDYYWLKVYFDIKLAESNIKLTKKKYNFHLEKIIGLASLNTGKTNKLSGVTTKNSGHVHNYNIDVDGNGTAAFAVHPTKPNIKHKHEIKNWVVQESQSTCYPDCVEGVGAHTHKINNDFLYGLNYINKVVRKKIQGLAQIYGDQGKIKEQNIGEMLMAADQAGVIHFPGSY